MQINFVSFHSNVVKTELGLERILSFENKKM